MDRIIMHRDTDMVRDGRCVSAVLPRRVQPLAWHVMIFAVFFGLVSFTVSVGPVGAQDAADDGGEAGFWAVEADSPELKMIVPRRGVGAGRVYWYLVYTLSNKTDETRDLFASVTATTDGKKKYSDIFLPGVERAAEKREGRTLWGKTDEYKVLSKRDPTDPRYQYFTVKKGEDRKSIAVFNSIDRNANEVRVRIAGLTNALRETVRDDGTKVLESRVLELVFTRAGDEFQVTQDSFQLKSKSWVKSEVVLAPATGG